MHETTCRICGKAILCGLPACPAASHVHVECANHERVQQGIVDP